MVLVLLGLVLSLGVHHEVLWVFGLDELIAAFSIRVPQVELTGLSRGLLLGMALIEGLLRLEGRLKLRPVEHARAGDLPLPVDHGCPVVNWLHVVLFFHAGAHVGLGRS